MQKAQNRKSLKNMDETRLQSLRHQCPKLTRSSTAIRSSKRSITHASRPKIWRSSDPTERLKRRIKALHESHIAPCRTYRMMMVRWSGRTSRRRRTIRNGSLRVRLASAPSTGSRTSHLTTMSSCTRRQKTQMRSTSTSLSLSPTQFTGRTCLDSGHSKAMLPTSSGSAS